MPSHRLPELPAFEVRDAHQPQWAAWCPWCEDMHRHSPEGGHVCAHCWSKASPLLTTGYSLRKVGTVDRESDAHPKDFGVSYNPSLHHALQRETKTLRALFLRVILGVSPAKARQQRFTQKLLGGDRVVIDGLSWSIERLHGETTDGHGLADLAMRLHGVPPGVLAVRLLEATPLGRMDSAGALAVQAAVDAWRARGASSRDDQR